MQFDLIAFGTSRLYGVMIALGIYLSAQVAAWILKREGQNPQLVWDGLVWVVVTGIIGARLYHVIDYWSYYSTNLDQIVAVWRGGLGIFGGLLGGVLGLLAFIKFRSLAIAKAIVLAEAVVIAVPLGQAIGRWGNYFNQERYGFPTDLPWGIFISPERRLPGYELFEKFHPLFLYESLLSLAFFGLLLFLYLTKRLRLGQISYVYVYLIGYGIIRALLEPMHLQSWSVSGVSVAQLLGLIFIVLGSLGLMFGRRHLSRLERWKQYFFLLVLFLVGCTRVPMASDFGAEDGRVTPRDQRRYETVAVLDSTLDVEVVNSPQRITLGLSYRNEIGAAGMLFVMPSRGVYSFWMKGMRFNLDMLWFDCGAEGVGSLDLSGCELVHVTRNAPAPAEPETERNLPTYSPGEPVTHVLELVAGDYERLFGD